MTDEALRELQPRFHKLYAKTGRPSIAPEKLLRALLLQALYSVRSERLLMEQLDYNLLFRWFVGLNMDDAIWDVTVFTKNRERLLEGDIAEAFFQAVLQQARERSLAGHSKRIVSFHKRAPDYLFGGDIVEPERRILRSAILYLQNALPRRPSKVTESCSCGHGFVEFRAWFLLPTEGEIGRLRSCNLGAFRARLTRAIPTSVSGSAIHCYWRMS
jgi:hypothetical protein